MTARPGHVLPGDAASCRAAAAALRASAAHLAAAWADTCLAVGADSGGPAGPHPQEPARGVPTAAVLARAEHLAAALDRFGAELRRAQHEHAAAQRDLERNTALALAARARRRLRLACADTAPAGPLAWRP